MKSYYLNPELEVIELKLDDVIVTSETVNEETPKTEQIGVTLKPL